MTRFIHNFVIFKTMLFCYIKTMHKVIVRYADIFYTNCILYYIKSCILIEKTSWETTFQQLSYFPYVHFCVSGYVRCVTTVCDLFA